MTTPEIGVVIIGRNEGERLAACLNSVRAARVAQPEIVYVDSNSTDNSCDLALAYRAQVVQLDPNVPFTAARARNAGANVLLENHPSIKFLQFLDGDTEVNAEWIALAAEYLEHHPTVAAACGRRREKNPAASIYNYMADMEWNTPVGKADEFGGDALIRAEVFRKLQGYNADFIAGEEPEFAARMRKSGYQIARLGHEMTLHDLAMFRFQQWFRRTLRSGHAIAQLHHAHGRPPLRLYHKQWRSTLFWMLVLPLGIVALAVATTVWMLLLYPAALFVLLLRVGHYRQRRGDDVFAAFIYALFTVMGKFPQLLGMLTFYLNRLRNRQSTIIEYKTAAAPARGTESVAPTAAH